MIKVETRQTVSIDKGKLFQLIIGYSDYPSFVYGVKSVHVQRKGPGKARVTYTVSIIKDLVYTIDLVENENLGTVSWRLVRSDFFKTNNGFWNIRDLGSGKCEVRYGVELEFKFPIPKLILRQLVKVILPTMVKSFEKRARELTT
jgi:ribosome-associated toxin RatA of RatAB toxin-antitoxin module